MRYVLTAAAFIVTASCAHGQISSTFDSDSEGWSTLNDATGFVWDDTIGNPGGAIRARDIGDGRIWMFAASPDYLGNREAYYGGSISWDIRGVTGNQTSIPGRADVILVGGGLQIGIDGLVQPILNEWTSWSVDFTAGDWRTISSLNNATLSATAVTEAQFRSVLSNLTGLYIRGEYTNGADAAALDNVLMVIPAPGGIGLLAALGGIAAVRRRRQLLPRTEAVT